MSFDGIRVEIDPLLDRDTLLRMYRNTTHEYWIVDREATAMRAIELLNDALQPELPTKFDA